MGLLKWYLGIFVLILPGLVEGIRADGFGSVGDVDVDANAGPAGVVTMVAQNTLYRGGGMPVSLKVQGTPGTKRTATTRAAGPCPDTAKRYADCGNGTVTDTLTGLIWLKQPNCLAAANWEDAKKAVAGLKNGDCMLTDGSSPGDWRLPTKTDWEATMKNAKGQGCKGPTLTNDAGTACISAGPSSFTGVEPDYYWSSTPVGPTNPRTYFGDLDHGLVLNGVQTNSLRVWPVRGEQP